METLIMLLDIYEEEVVWIHSIWDKITDKEEAWICSKKFWFIKRLVKNDKINLDKLKIFDIFWDLNERVGTESNVLCHLAIQDEPIEFLIQLLK